MSSIPVPQAIEAFLRAKEVPVQAQQTRPTTGHGCGCKQRSDRVNEWVHVFGIGILILPFGARKLMEQAEASTASSWLEPAETTLNTEEARPVDQTTEIPRA